MSKTDADLRVDLLNAGQAIIRENTRLRNLLREVSTAGVVIHIPGKYVEVQIDEQLMNEIKKAAEVTD